VKPKYSPRKGRTSVSSDGCTRGLLSRGAGHRADEIDRSLQNVRTQTERGSAGPGNQSRLDAKPQGGRNRADSLPAGLPALCTAGMVPTWKGKFPRREEKCQGGVTGYFRHSPSYGIEARLAALNALRVDGVASSRSLD
jgi:hypothetical protein